MYIRVEHSLTFEILLSQNTEKNDWADGYDLGDDEFSFLIIVKQREVDA